MRILFYGINYSPELTGIGKYTAEMSVWFAERGHSVSVVSAQPYYPEWSIHEGFSNRFSHDISNGIDVYRCPLYVPKSPNTIKRIIHLATFSITSLFRLWSLRRSNYDVVVCVVPSLFSGLGAKWFARRVGAKSVIHIQDYEVDAMFGLGMKGIKSHLSKFAYLLETHVLKSFDLVSTISRTMVKKALSKGVNEDKVSLFPNWSETDKFKGPFDSGGMRKKLGLPKEKKIILYSGNMGEKQGLESVIELAKRLRSRDDVLFLLVGEGGARAKLEKQAQEYSLDNLMFHDLLPFEDLPQLLNLAHTHLVIQKSGVADAVLPSKLTNILAVGGTAIITAEQETELGRLCLEHPGIAVRIEPESIEELVSSVEDRLLVDRKLNQTAVDYATDYLEKEQILTAFEHSLVALLK